MGKKARKNTDNELANSLWEKLVLYKYVISRFLSLPATHLILKLKQNLQMTSNSDEIMTT